MKIKRVLVLLLAFLLVFSNSAMAAVGPITQSNVDRVNQQKPTSNNKEKLDKEELDELYEDDDEVRVIVEVEGEPAITYATKQGQKFADLSEAKKDELHNNALATQQKVQTQLTKKKVDLELKQNFTTVFNGFSGVVKFGEIKNIEKIFGVKNVIISNEYERPEVTPDMKYSTELVEAQKTWDEYGYDGEGMIVGVIDTGVDPSHRDFVLTDEEAAALSEEDVEQFVAENNLPGKWYSAKVPYGYNYMDENDEVRDLGPDASMHGMHVSGTVGANGDLENGGIKGVAPEAQILGLKVFGNDPNMGSTYSDVYVKAIDDAIILGADVINMSLGSTAAFVDSDDPEQQAVNRAVENGVLMSISAGNSAFLGNGFFNPFASNPDYGVVGSPGVSVDSLQVASIENSFIDLDALTFNYGENTGLAPFMSASSVHPNDIAPGAYEIVAVGIGDAAGFEGVDVEGKFAYAQRGNSFVDTALNAVAAGAAGVIVYNNQDGWVNMASDPAVNIPQLFMGKTDGEELAAALVAGETVTISFNGDKVTEANPTADAMSQFSSWGLTPNLDFKPEITAPGGSILSTFNDDEYGMMNGTSMAAPHVAGGAALVLQRVDEHFDVEGKDRVELAKNILMNTAAPVVDKGVLNTELESGLFYSPRKQGAGLMQLHKAISTPVVVTEETTGLGKVALREVDEEFSFTLVAENVTDEDVSYDVATQLQTDLQILGLTGNAYYTGALGELESAELVGDVTINGGESTVTVPANGTASIEVTVDLSEALVFTIEAGYVDPNTVFPNGYWVEGFVTFTDATGDTLPQLSVPYVGFAGEWDAAPIVDALALEGPDYSFYETGSMVYDDGEGGLYYIGMDQFTGAHTENIAISPNGDNVNDQAIPVLSFLRNAKTVEYLVQDAEGNVLRNLGKEGFVRKNYYDAGYGPMQSIKSSFAWDGKVKNEVAEDGQYFVNVKATIDYPGAEAQDFLIPVTVDTVAPELEVSIEDNVVSYTTEDATSGVSYVEIFADGESLGIVPADLGELPFEEIPAGTTITLVAEDWAGNVTAKSLAGINDGDAPVIYVDAPGGLGKVFNTNEINYAGTVTDDSEIVEFTIDGQDVELTEVAPGEYEFDTVLTFEDGKHTPRLVAVDVNGNETSLQNSQLFFVDTTPAELSVEAPETVQTETVELAVNIVDNNEEIRLYVDGSEVFYNEWLDLEVRPFEDTVTVEVDVELGVNELEVKVADLAGNETVETVVVNRVNVDRISGSDRYETAVLASQKGWETADVVILARADDYADALAGAPLAAAKDAPLLLTKTDELQEATKAEIERLGATKVFVLGGESAVSESVVAELEAAEIEVTRVKGDDRIGTAVEIAKLVAGDGNVEDAVVVNGFNFPDALSVASYAARNNQPILLTKTDKLSEETAQALVDLGVENTVVVGGTAAVSEEVFAELPNADRVSGKDRYATAVEVAEYFGVETNHLYVATGKHFADALSSAALAAKEGAGVLLVGNDVSEVVKEYVSNETDTLTVLGGTSVISDEILDELSQLLD
ncbi:cell wall-binding repeat-containing protein [Ornithinibacillus halophilus]|uniref:Lactocepin n=1 Tax=Ornithinibacillus halophilus TaxID=930117 RepID=A0A1M5EAP5_9BACI|nr:cell wall-binding repeat-containing protein [Ornithinibacillus halophilus]SHF76256.1 lactocepin [Ornithinibacillus halophilus]